MAVGERPMHTLVNYIVAAAAAMLVLVITLDVGSFGNSVEAEASRMDQMVSTIEVIERDLRNLGASKNSLATVFPAGSIDTTSCYVDATRRCGFSFWSRIDDATNEGVSRRGIEGGDTVMVRYEWQQIGSTLLVPLDTTRGAAARPESADIYRLSRNVYPTDHRLPGRADFDLKLVNEFRIRMLRQDGTVAPSALYTRRIEVSISAHAAQDPTPGQITTMTTDVSPVNLTRLN